MSAIINKKRKRHLLHPRYIFSLASIFFLALLVAGSFLALTEHKKGTRTHASPSFGFTVAGDYAQTKYTTNNLQYIKKQYAANQISFNLGLGDFNYSPNSNADVWSTYAKSNLPPNFPFEIVAGRHDTSELVQYKVDLPNYMGNISGSYGQEYYFDYPASAPLARFILISPNQTIPGYTYNYNKNGADYKWVSNTIDDARCANTSNCTHPMIPWVIVGMHEYCFVIGTSTCNNQDLLDLLLNKHVDVVLQAQKHNYQRSKQLALTQGSCITQCCPTLSTTSYNPICVANATSSLTQGAGSVIVLTGTGGTTPQLAIATSDPKLSYFNNWMPANNVTWGVSQFTLSATQLTEQFVAVSGGSFADSFTITNSSSTPPPTTTVTVTTTPCPRVTATATPVPTATPCPTISPSPTVTATPRPTTSPSLTVTATKTPTATPRPTTSPSPRATAT